MTQQRAHHLERDSRIAVEGALQGKTEIRHLPIDALVTLGIEQPAVALDRERMKPGELPVARAVPLFGVKRELLGGVVGDSLQKCPAQLTVL